MSEREAVIEGGPSGADQRALESAAVFLKLMRASGVVTNRVFGQLPGAGSGGQFIVLEALHTLGPMRQSDLAYKILKTTGNVTQLVDRLEREGLVKRTRSEKDRRVVVAEDHCGPMGHRCAFKLQILGDTEETLQDLKSFPGRHNQRELVAAPQQQLYTQCSFAVFFHLEIPIRASAHQDVL